MKASGKVDEIDYLEILKETVQAELPRGMVAPEIDYLALL